LGRRLRVSEIATMAPNVPTPPVELNPGASRSWEEQLDMARAANDMLLEEVCARVRNGDVGERTASFLSKIIMNARTGVSLRPTDDPDRMTDAQLQAAVDAGNSSEGIGKAP